MLWFCVTVQRSAHSKLGSRHGGDSMDGVESLRSGASRRLLGDKEDQWKLQGTVSIFTGMGCHKASLDVCFQVLYVMLSFRKPMPHQGTSPCPALESQELWANKCLFFKKYLASAILSATRNRLAAFLKWNNARYAPIALQVQYQDYISWAS